MVFFSYNALNFETCRVFAIAIFSSNFAFDLFFYMQDKYKVYNLCLERLYDASLFEGKVIFYFHKSWIGKMC
jgi:uncharacterized membrane protein YwaF